MRIAALACLAVAVAAAQPPAPSLLVLNDVNLIDGAGKPARAHVRLTLRGDRIQSIEDATRPLPPGAVVWNLAGMTVIPGLIEAHVHLTSGPTVDDQTVRMLRFGLLGGVTSVRDMGGDAVVLAGMARNSRDPDQAGPRIYFSTLVAGPQWFADPRPKAVAHGGVPGEVAWLHALTPQTDIPAVIRDGKATGATGLKIYADLPPELVARAIAEAHRQGMKVWSHSAVFPTKPSELVAAGADVISHTVYLGSEGMNTPPTSYEAARRGLGIDYTKTPVDGEALTALFRLMKDKGTILDETLFVTNLNKRGDDDPIWQWTIAATRRAHELGIPLAAGTDSFGGPRDGSVPNLHRELRFLVEKCGLTPVEAIQSATQIAARAIGIESSYGTVEAGKVADLVILREDPASDIGRTENIAAVIKGGVVFQR